MRKLILTAGFLALAFISGAQVSLENNYAASTGLTELSISGYKYFTMDVAGNQCRIYHTDHSLWKTINLSMPAGMYLYDIRYVSETLFNTDNKVELAYIYYEYDTLLYYYTYYARVINEDGQEIVSIPGCAYLDVRSAGAAGNKLLAYVYDYSIINWTVNTLVYSLPGTLSGTESLTAEQSGIRKPFPNPAITTITIPYELPYGTGTGEIRLMDPQGRRLRTFRVDGTFRDLVIPVADLPSGVYNYEVVTGQGIVNSGKIIRQR